MNIWTRIKDYFSSLLPEASRDKFMQDLADYQAQRALERDLFEPEGRWSETRYSFEKDCV